MHGLIVNQLRQYVIERHGRDAWESLRTGTGVAIEEGPVPIRAGYADTDVLALITAASERFGAPIPEILDDFGTFIAPTLLRIYEPLIPKHWRTLDVVENTENTIHTVVRGQEAGIALPPHLRVTREAPDLAVVEYTSPRKLCALATGIVRGIAAEYGEEVRLDQPECMLRGDSRCMIRVRKV